ncbi:hypothetical protein GCM10022377_21480 [Zhihengliuella alba]|uniref:Tryptophan-rich sensory protein n=1 Tax=Zhihengliuella alba TaxID=547018 RepID=A0ABP7DMG2_9MICC
MPEPTLPPSRAQGPSSRAQGRLAAGTLLPAVLALVGAVAAIAAAAIGSGAAGGTPIAEAAGGWLGAEATPLAPASGAFSIWSAVYAGLLGYAVLQLLPSRRRDPRHRSLRVLAVGSMILNAVWIWVVQAGWLGLSLVVILALLAVLGAVFVRTARTRPASRWDALLVDSTFGLYLGWVTVAAVANAAAWLGSLGLFPQGGGTEGAAAGEAAWAGPVAIAAGAALAGVAVLGVLLAAAGRGRLAPAAAMVWGLAWLAVGRFAGPDALPGTAVVALLAAAVIAAATVWARLRAAKEES